MKRKTKHSIWNSRGLISAPDVPFLQDQVCEWNQAQNSLRHLSITKGFIVNKEMLGTYELQGKNVYTL